jgi:hypothetical protein
MVFVAPYITGSCSNLIIILSLARVLGDIQNRNCKGVVAFPNKIFHFSVTCFIEIEILFDQIENPTLIDAVLEVFLKAASVLVQFLFIL